MSFHRCLFSQVGLRQRTGCAGDMERGKKRREWRNSDGKRKERHSARRWHQAGGGGGGGIKKRGQHQRPCARSSSPSRTSVKRNCCSTSGLTVEHSRHMKLPRTSSGWTALVRTTVPEECCNSASAQGEDRNARYPVPPRAAFHLSPSPKVRTANGHQPPNDVRFQIANAAREGREKQRLSVRKGARRGGGGATMGRSAGRTSAPRAASGAQRSTPAARRSPPWPLQRPPQPGP